MPSSENWTQISALLDAVLDLPPDERTAYLDDACDDPAVRAEVEALLQAETDAPPFLEGNAAGLATPLIADEDAPSSEPENLQIGPYRLVEEIGRGGMGVVYRAERADGQFEREVALKLLPRYFETESRRARFRAERQILASLTHPNIARLLDGGVTETGRPYLVMEHVEGPPITDYCASHALPVEARLRLLRMACGAVEHAHHSLVVHRDLKPSNILVTETEDGPQVKLLDFGIAKLLDERTAWTQPLTRTGERLLTPEYAAPEQLTGEAITTATDVYQLGVLAYEVLTGRRPFDLEDKSLTEIERILLETDPERPSKQVGGLAEGTRSLQGDLDTIVLKALRKEPERRYGSAEALADDLQRYLDGRPVTARPATWRYRTRKFVHRNRGGVGVAVLIATLLVVAFAAITQQRNVAVRERDRATQEMAKAEQVSDFLMSLFEASAPERARGETVTARDLLDLGAERAAGLDGQPDVQAQMFETIAEIYRLYGEYEPAGDLLNRALQLRHTLHDGAHPDVARTLHGLAVLRKDEGAFEEADTLLQQTITMLRTLHEGPDPELASALSNLSSLRSEQGDYSAAEELAREALSMREALFAAPHEDIATSLNNLAAVHYRLDQFEAAIPLYEESLAMHRELLGNDHPNVAALLNNLANLYHSMSDYKQSTDYYDDAEAYRREALALDRKLYGERHRYVASDLVSLGSILSDRGQHEEAEALLREAVAMQRSLLGADHPDVAIAMNHLGIALSAQGAYTEAEAILLDVLAFRRARFDEAHPRTANTLKALGNIYRATARNEQAAEYYREAAALLRETVGASGQKLTLVLDDLAGVLTEIEDWPAAENTYRQILDIYRNRTPLDTLGTAAIHVDLGRTLLEQGAVEEAGQHFHTGRQMLRTIGREDHRAAREASSALRHLQRR